jgi:hypothetical protein
MYRKQRQTPNLIEYTYIEHLFVFISILFFSSSFLFYYFDFDTFKNILILNLFLTFLSLFFNMNFKKKYNIEISYLSRSAVFFVLISMLNNINLVFFNIFLTSH